MFPILHTKNTQNIRSKSRYFVLLQSENKLDFKLLKHITIMAKKALLMILDGWGCGDHHKDDVIFNTPTPYWDSLLANYPHSQEP